MLSTMLRLFSLALVLLGQRDSIHTRHPLIDSLLELKPSEAQVRTNTYHLNFAWTVSSNATGYAVLVKTNSVEAWRVWTTNTTTTVSNLGGNLEQYRFSCIATNLAGESAESDPAVAHWMTVLESDSLQGPWTLLATNGFIPAKPQHYISLSNYNALSLAKPD